MVKKQRRIFIICICVLLFGICLCGAYMYYYRTINISVEDCEPTEGTILAYIDGKPYYYDPVYLFKLTDSAFPKEPSITDKKKALFYELAYMESVKNGKTVSETVLKDGLRMRKYDVENWDNALTKEEKSLKENMNDDAYSAESIADQKEEVAELEQYVSRYYELWTECTEGEGITATEYWQVCLPYLKKAIIIEAYTSAQIDAYLQKTENREDGNNIDYFSDAFLLQNFDALVEKYQVKIVDPGLK